MKHLLSVVKKLLDQQMLLHGQGCLQEVDKLFILFQLLLQLQKKLIEEEMRVEEVRSLYYLFGEMPYRGPQSLVAQVSFQIPQ